jgi:hypothetical protein
VPLLYVVGNIAFGYRGRCWLAVAFMDCVIDKVTFEVVSSLARRVGSPWRPGLEIGAFRRVKQSAKQFEGKVNK